MSKANGAVWKPTHKTRVWYVSAHQTKIQRTVKTSDGDVTAEAGDYICQYGNGAINVMKQHLFESNFEPIPTKKEEDDEKHSDLQG